MTLVFDTSILVEIERNNLAIKKHISKLVTTHPEQPSITFATFAEFYYGFLKKYPQRREEALNALNEYNTLHTNRESTKIFSELKLTLEQKGSMLSLFDLLIASITLAQNKTLVTQDKRFQDVPGLKLIYFEKQKY